MYTRPFFSWPFWFRRENLIDCNDSITRDNTNYSSFFDNTSRRKLTGIACVCTCTSVCVCWLFLWCSTYGECLLTWNMINELLKIRCSDIYIYIYGILFSFDRIVVALWKGIDWIPLYSSLNLLQCTHLGVFGFLINQFIGFIDSFLKIV